MVLSKALLLLLLYSLLDAVADVVSQAQHDGRGGSFVWMHAQ